MSGLWLLAAGAASVLLAQKLASYTRRRLPTRFAHIQRLTWGFDFDYNVPRVWTGKQVGQIVVHAAQLKLDKEPLFNEFVVDPGAYRIVLRLSAEFTPLEHDDV